MPKNAVVFFTHRFDAGVHARYLELREQSSRSGAACFVLAPVETRVPQELREETHFFDFSRASARVPRMLGTTLQPGNLHVPLLDFHAARPEFEFYWFIEYDVVFRGDWADFFDAFRDDASDLLAAHVRTHAEEPRWCWWPSLEMPGPSPDARLRAFLPIQRLSQRGLRALSESVQAGWSGHFEALIPSALRSASLVVSDIGGDGSFVPEQRRNRFYTSFSCCNGALIGLGSLRFRPTRLRPGARQGLLYHPVKSAADRHWDPHVLRHFVHLARRHPRRLVRHLWTSLGMSLTSMRRGALGARAARLEVD